MLSIIDIIKEEIENLQDPNLQISYIPQGYKHTILDEKDTDDDSEEENNEEKV